MSFSERNHSKSNCHEGATALEELALFNMDSRCPKPRPRNLGFSRLSIEPEVESLVYHQPPQTTFPPADKRVMGRQSEDSSRKAIETNDDATEHAPKSSSITVKDGVKRQTAKVGVGCISTDQKETLQRVDMFILVIDPVTKKVVYTSDSVKTALRWSKESLEGRKFTTMVDLRDMETVEAFYDLDEYCHEQNWKETQSVEKTYVCMIETGNEPIVDRLEEYFSGNLPVVKNNKTYVPVQLYGRVEFPANSKHVGVEDPLYECVGSNPLLVVSGKLLVADEDWGEVSGKCVNVFMTKQLRCGRIYCTSKGPMERLGYDARKMCADAHNFFDLVYEADRQWVQARFDTTLESGGFSRTIFRMYCGDGSLAFVDVEAHAAFDEKMGTQSIHVFPNRIFVEEGSAESDSAVYKQTEMRCFMEPGRDILGTPATTSDESIDGERSLSKPMLQERKATGMRSMEEMQEDEAGRTNRRGTEASLRTRYAVFTVKDTVTHEMLLREDGRVLWDSLHQHNEDKEVFTLVHPEDENRFYKHFLDTLKGGSSAQMYRIGALASSDCEACLYNVFAEMTMQAFRDDLGVYIKNTYVIHEDSPVEDWMDDENKRVYDKSSMKRIL